jgi:hypothetical protein
MISEQEDEEEESWIERIAGKRRIRLRRLGQDRLGMQRKS